MRVIVTARAPRDVKADVVVELFELPVRRADLRLRSHLRSDVVRLVGRDPGMLTWFDARNMAAPRVLMACRGRANAPVEAFGLCGDASPAQQAAAEREALRHLGGRIERACDEHRLRRVVLVPPGDVDPTLLVEGMLMRAHATTELTPDEEATSLTQVTVCVDKKVLSETKTRMAETVSVVEATNLARTLADLPGNIGTPEGMVLRAKAATKPHGIKASVISAAQAKKAGMGLFSAVASGSGVPASILVLEHNARHGDDLPTLAFVGKGVTHDTGGYNLKTTARLHELTYDKSGAAAVIGAMQAIARLEVPLHVVGVAPLVENCIGAHAYKPGDVLTAIDGTTVYVENTDAEGRLLLADCLSWVSRFDPELVIDIATLTSASNVALGLPFAALYANDDEARTLLMNAADETGDLLWPMPIHPDHALALRHHMAQLRNVGMRPGAASLAAAFLRHFTDYPWAHIDIAGKATAAFERADVGLGATGFGTRLLVRAAQAFARAHEVEVE